MLGNGRKEARLNGVKKGVVVPLNEGVHKKEMDENFSFPEDYRVLFGHCGGNDIDWVIVKYSLKVVVAFLGTGQDRVTHWEADVKVCIYVFGQNIIHNQLGRGRDSSKRVSPR